MTDEVKRIEEEHHSRLKSTKFWVTLWAIALISFVVIADRAAYTDIAQWLCAVPLGYIGANVWQKQIREGKK